MLDDQRGASSQRGTTPAAKAITSARDQSIPSTRHDWRPPRRSEVVSSTKCLICVMENLLFLSTLSPRPVPVKILIRISNLDVFDGFSTVSEPYGCMISGHD